MDQLFSDLNEFEAIDLHDSYLAKLPHGEYTIAGVRRSFRGGQIYVTALDNITRHEKPPRQVIAYADEEGNQVTVEDYQKFFAEFNEKYRDEDTYEYHYSTLEEEFEARKELSYWSDLERVYNEPKETTEDVKLTIVGSALDTGSKFIESPIFFGKVAWDKDRKSLFRVKTAAVAMDEAKKIIEENKDNKGFKVDLPGHSHLQYLKINGEYMFTQVPYNYIKQAGTTSLAPTLEDAKSTEATVRASIRDRINMLLNPAQPTEADLLDIIKDLQSIRTSMSSVDSKVKTYRQHTATITKLNDLVRKVESMAATQKEKE